MVKTIAEANVTWCPMSMGSLHGHSLDARCANVNCMAWRWASALERRIRVPNPFLSPGAPEAARPDDLPASWTWETDVGDGDPPAWVEPVTDASARRLGYCGLAGKPTIP